MKPETESDWQDRIRRAQSLIESRLDEEIPIEELAAAVNASLFHFHRVFRGLTGETVREYARRLRLERAAHRLKHAPNMDILSVALEALYESHEAFTRAFKRHFGMTPSEFRASSGQQETPLGEVSMNAVSDNVPSIRIEHRPARFIAFVRHVGPYHEVGQAWRTLMTWGWSKMMFGKPETFGLCYDDPETTPVEKLRYDACMVVGERTRPKGSVQVRWLQETTYAFARHDGPLESIDETYARLFAEIAKGPIDGIRWRLGDPPSLERYLTDPRKVRSQEMRTEVGMPVVRVLENAETR